MVLACQRISKNKKKAELAADRDEYIAASRYHDLVGRDVELIDHDDHQIDVPAPRGGRSRLAEFQAPLVVSLSETDLLIAFGSLCDDPAAQRAIVEELARRDEQLADADADVAWYRNYERDAAMLDLQLDDSPLTNPATRPGRALSDSQRCWDDFDRWVYLRYLQLKVACCGELLTDEARELGITALALMVAPAPVMQRYASLPMRVWVSRAGRLTWAQWRQVWTEHQVRIHPNPAPDSDSEACR